MRVSRPSASLTRVQEAPQLPSLLCSPQTPDPLQHFPAEHFL